MRTDTTNIVFRQQKSGWFGHLAECGCAYIVVMDDRDAYLEIEEGGDCEGPHVETDWDVSSAAGYHTDVYVGQRKKGRWRTMAESYVADHMDAHGWAYAQETAGT